MGFFIIDLSNVFRGLINADYNTVLFSKCVDAIKNSLIFLLNVIEIQVGASID